MPTFASLAQKNSLLIFRYLQNAVFAAPISADPLTNMMMSAGVLKAFPTGYFCLGHSKSDGTEVSRDVDTEDTESDGTLAATRKDRTKDDKTIQVIAQESNLKVIGMYYDIVTTGIATDVNGEIKIVHPTVADQLEYRLFRLGYDSKRGMFHGIHFVRAVLGDPDSRTIGTKSNDEWKMTFGAMQDDSVGTDMISFWAGPKTVMQAMGANVTAMT